MASLNKVLLMGNLTRDPELRYIPNGSAVTSFTLAMNRTYKLQTGEKKEETTFMKIVVWGRMAEICGEYLKKGSGAFVEGRLQSRTWDAPDGQKRSAVEVIAQNVQFLGRPSGQGGSPRGERDFDQTAGAAKEELGEIQLDEMPDAGPKAEEETPF